MKWFLLGFLAVPFLFAFVYVIDNAAGTDWAFPFALVVFGACVLLAKYDRAR